MVCRTLGCKAQIFRECKLLLHSFGQATILTWAGGSYSNYMSSHKRGNYSSYSSYKAKQPSMLDLQDSFEL